ncbi:MAG: YdcF family protein [Solirubrobacterales bacterium]|nr:YdcF family protein [Solirubrobacterales bacterium]
MALRDRTRSFAGRHRRLLIGGGAVFTSVLLLVAGANVWVLTKGDAPTFSEAKAAPHAETAIVLGAYVEPDGRMSKMLSDRVKQAASLWKDGKVEKILVSGDHGQWKYDEPDTMKNALVADGIPGKDIFTDHAGFNTRASMVRAHDVFKVSDALVVTQGFHMKRALYLAVDADGVTSDLHTYGGQGIKSSIREIASRVKAVGDVAFGSDVMGGPDVPITGNASESRGPTPPSGTPAAGVPNG